MRRAYQGASSRSELTTNLDFLQRLSGFTRVVILTRAAQLGLAFSQRRPWAEHEDSMLREYAGQKSLGRIAVHLNRTPASVRARLKKLELSARISDGYTVEDLRQLLGVGARTVRLWIANGWLRPVAGRIPEGSVVRFLRVHPEQYRLGHVDEAWFKGLLFPVYNHAHDRELRAREGGGARRSALFDDAAEPKRSAPEYNLSGRPAPRDFEGSTT